MKKIIIKSACFALLAISTNVLSLQPVKAAVTYDYVTINGYTAYASLGIGSGYARASTTQGSRVLNLTSQVNANFANAFTRSPVRSGFGVVNANVYGAGVPTNITGYHTASGYGQTKKMVTSY